MVQFLESEAVSLEEYKEILAIPCINLWIKWGSLFDDKLPLLKAKYTFEESIDPKEFIKLLVDERGSWDVSLMESTEIETLTPEISIIHYVVKPPVFLMKPRDFAEKKIRFECNGVFYGYHGSIPESTFPSIAEYQRCETVFSGNILRKEGNSYIYYTFSQMNLNVLVYAKKQLGNMSSALVTSYMPSTSKSFYKKISEELEKRKANYS